MTHGPRVSAAGAGACGGRALAGRAGPKPQVGCARAVARGSGLQQACAGSEGSSGSCLFFFFYFLFEHSKTMHRHECNREFL
jgi:hypothetical protein